MTSATLSRLVPSRRPAHHRARRSDSAVDYTTLLTEAIAAAIANSAKTRKRVPSCFTGILPVGRVFVTACKRASITRGQLAEAIPSQEELLKLAPKGRVKVKVEILPHVHHLQPALARGTVIKVTMT